MTGVTLRPARADDAAAVTDVFTAARRGMTYLPRLHTAEEDARFIAHLVEKARVQLAVRADGVVGFAAVHDGWLEHLYVVPAAQRAGVGSTLIDWAKAASPAGLDLWVFEANTGARALYLFHGWTEVERTDGRHNEERLPDLHMRWTPSETPPPPTAQ
jgi:GNAT superfamily N-acetyltransferase